MSGRILLVEDDAAVATLYERTLTSQGFQVQVAATGTEGLTYARTAPFDAIVSDIAMPEMDGVQLLERVRELDPLVPVLFLTGSAQVETVKRAIELKAFRYLIKPVNLRALVASVRRAASCCRWVRAREQAALVAKGDPTLGLPAPDQAARFEEALSLMRVYFQPVLDLSTRELRGFRSVARSPHPAFPSFRELRRAADKLGRREELRRKLWEMTTAPLAALSDSLLLLIWTDVSGLSDAVAHEALRARAQQIVLMVSDRAGISDGASEHESLARLRGAGFRLGVDQLGEGYAGLSALAWLEPEFLELDAALARRVSREPEQLRVVSALSGLAKELGATLIAENVVDERDAQALADVGCVLLSWGALATPDELAPFSAEAISELRVLPGPSLTTP